MQGNSKQEVIKVVTNDKMVAKYGSVMVIHSGALGPVDSMFAIHTGS